MQEHRSTPDNHVARPDPDDPATLGDPSRRARSIIVALILIWTATWATLAVIWTATQGSPQDVATATGSTIAAVPMSALLIATLTRPQRVAGAYWFLPLYYLTTGLGGAAVTTAYLITSTTEQHLYVPLINAIPNTVFGTLLIIVRPRST